MNDTPRGWPRISSSLYYEDPRHAIDWLCAAFGFEVRLKVEGADGGIEHSELTYGGGVIMVSSGAKASRPDSVYRAPPGAVGGKNTQNLFVYVDDVDAHCEHARAAGAKILTQPATTDYGEGYWADRSYEAEDPGAHHWWFAQRMRG